MKSIYRQQEQGAVSLFVVIFAALLLSVVTVSFVRVMNQEQRQATDNDLSQSAYDSALSGVEDAKRVVLACERSGSAGSDPCRAIERKECDTVARAGIAAEEIIETNAETPIQTRTSGGSELNQAYTCVKIDTTSTDYLTNMDEGQTVMVPLRATGTVDRIEINWFKEENDTVSPPNATAALNTLTTLAGDLPKRANWPANGPALMETQVIQPDANFTLADLDSSAVTQTVYLYPSRVGATNIALSGVQRDTASSPRTVRCDAVRYQGGGYLCSATLELTRPLLAGSQVAFMRLSSIYRGSSVQVIMRNGTEPVRFDGVQFTADVTGRANDIFRRVESRLSVGQSDFPYPDGAVDISGSLCKDFFVSSDSAGGVGCTP